MKERPLLLCCWPGLAQLWLRGTWSALFLAVGSAVLLNLALVSSFVWPTLFGVSFTWVAWPILLVIWTASAWISYYWLGTEHEARLIPKVDQDTLFNQAQIEYLKGEWGQAEDLLRRRLTKTARDVESRLLLATIYRRTERWERAEQQLDQLEKLDASQAWEQEIFRERQMIPADRPAAEDSVTEGGENQATQGHTDLNDGETDLDDSKADPDEAISNLTEVDGMSDSVWPKAA